MGSVRVSDGENGFPVFLTRSNTDQKRELTPPRPLPKKVTKRMQRQERLEKAVRFSLECAESTPEVKDAEELKKIRVLLLHVNACVQKASRERTGQTHNRFHEDDVYAPGAAGNDGAHVERLAGRVRVTACHRAQGEEEELPNYGSDERINLIRLSRRLVGGARALPPLKRMCDALGLRNDGQSAALSNRIEAKLRELKFEQNTSFVPTAADVILGLEDFNEKFEHVPPLTLAAVERTLRGLVVAGA